MGAAELRRRRATAQLIHAPAAAPPVEIVRALLAVQAQDPRAARLALRARSRGLTAAAVDAALDDRSLVAGWLGRGTLHLVAREDYPWLLGLTAPGRTAGGGRRLAQLGITPEVAERAVAEVERALRAEGPLTRAQLGERLAARGIPTAGQALAHLLALAARRGVAVLGPVRDGAPAFALARDWLGAAPAVPLEGDARDAALRELARRYLTGHGPATAADLAAWAGLPLRDARAGLAGIGAELADHGADLVDLAARGAPPAGPIAPRLLPAFDPYLLGWRDRGFMVAAAHARRVHPGGGILRATATADGKAVAAWSARRRGARLAVRLEQFEPLGRALTAALEADAADVARFEGLEAA